MSTKDDDGPAFPHRWTVDATGMSLRDWFAGQALVGALATTQAFNLPDGTTSRKCTTPEDFAAVAYLYADAMLAERRKG